MSNSHGEKNEAFMSAIKSLVAATLLSKKNLRRKRKHPEILTKKNLEKKLSSDSSTDHLCCCEFEDGEWDGEDLQPCALCSTHPSFYSKGYDRNDEHIIPRLVCFCCSRRDSRKEKIQEFSVECSCCVQKNSKEDVFPSSRCSLCSKNKCEVLESSEESVSPERDSFSSFSLDEDKNEVLGNKKMKLQQKHSKNYVNYKYSKNRHRKRNTSEKKLPLNYDPRKFEFLEKTDMPRNRSKEEENASISNSKSCNLFEQKAVNATEEYRRSEKDFSRQFIERWRQKNILGSRNSNIARPKMNIKRNKILPGRISKSKNRVGMPSKKFNDPATAAQEVETIKLKKELKNSRRSGIVLDIVDEVKTRDICRTPERLALKKFDISKDKGGVLMDAHDDDSVFSHNRERDSLYDTESDDLDCEDDDLSEKRDYFSIVKRSDVLDEDKGDSLNIKDGDVVDENYSDFSDIEDNNVLDENELSDDEKGEALKENESDFSDVNESNIYTDNKSDFSYIRNNDVLGQNNNDISDIEDDVLDEHRIDFSYTKKGKALDDNNTDFSDIEDDDVLEKNNSDYLGINNSDVLEENSDFPEIKKSDISITNKRDFSGSEEGVILNDNMNVCFHAQNSINEEGNDNIISEPVNDIEVGKNNVITLDANDSDILNENNAATGTSDNIFVEDKQVASNVKKSPSIVDCQNRVKLENRHGSNVTLNDSDVITLNDSDTTDSTRHSVTSMSLLYELTVLQGIAYGIRDEHILTQSSNHATEKGNTAVCDGNESDDSVSSFTIPEVRASPLEIFSGPDHLALAGLSEMSLQVPNSIPPGGCGITDECSSLTGLSEMSLQVPNSIPSGGCGIAEESSSLTRLSEMSLQVPNSIPPGGCGITEEFSSLSLTDLEECWDIKKNIKKKVRCVETISVVHHNIEDLKSADGNKNGDSNFKDDHTFVNKKEESSVEVTEEQRDYFKEKVDDFVTKIPVATNTESYPLINSSNVRLSVSNSNDCFKKTVECESMGKEGGEVNSKESCDSGCTGYDYSDSAGFICNINAESFTGVDNEFLISKGNEDHSQGEKAGKVQLTQTLNSKQQHMIKNIVERFHAVLAEQTSKSVSLDGYEEVYRGKGNVLNKEVDSLSGTADFLKSSGCQSLKIKNSESFVISKVKDDLADSKKYKGELNEGDCLTVKQGKSALSCGNKERLNDVTPFIFKAVEVTTPCTRIRSNASENRAKWVRQKRMERKAKRNKCVDLEVNENLQTEDNRNLSSKLNQLKKLQNSTSSNFLGGSVKWDWENPIGKTDKSFPGVTWEWENPFASKVGSVARMNEKFTKCSVESSSADNEKANSETLFENRSSSNALKVMEEEPALTGDKTVVVEMNVNTGRQTATVKCPEKRFSSLDQNTELAREVDSELIRFKEIQSSENVGLTHTKENGSVEKNDNYDEKNNLTRKTIQGHSSSESNENECEKHDYQAGEACKIASQELRVDFDTETIPNRRMSSEEIIPNRRMSSEEIIPNRRMSSEEIILNRRMSSEEMIPNRRMSSEESAMQELDAVNEVQIQRKTLICQEASVRNPERVREQVEITSGNGERENEKGNEISEDLGDKEMTIETDLADDVRCLHNVPHSDVSQADNPNVEDHIEIIDNQNSFGTYLWDKYKSILGNVTKPVVKTEAEGKVATKRGSDGIKQEVVCKSEKGSDDNSAVATQRDDVCSYIQMLIIEQNDHLKEITTTNNGENADEWFSFVSDVLATTNNIRTLNEACKIMQSLRPRTIKEEQRDKVQCDASSCMVVNNERLPSCEVNGSGNKCDVPLMQRKGDMREVNDQSLQMEDVGECNGMNSSNAIDICSPSKQISGSCVKVSVEAFSSKHSLNVSDEIKLDGRHDQVSTKRAAKEIDDDLPRSVKPSSASCFGEKETRPLTLNLKHSMSFSGANKVDLVTEDSFKAEMDKSEQNCNAGCRGDDANNAHELAIIYEGGIWKVSGDAGSEVVDKHREGNVLGSENMKMEGECDDIKSEDMKMYREGDDAEYKNINMGREDDDAEPEDISNGREGLGVESEAISVGRKSESESKDAIVVRKIYSATSKDDRDQNDRKLFETREKNSKASSSLKGNNVKVSKNSKKEKLLKSTFEAEKERKTETKSSQTECDDGDKEKSREKQKSSKSPEESNAKRFSKGPGSLRRRKKRWLKERIMKTQDNLEDSELSNSSCSFNKKLARKNSTRSSTAQGNVNPEAKVESIVDGRRSRLYKKSFRKNKHWKCRKSNNPPCYEKGCSKCIHEYSAESGIAGCLFALPEFELEKKWKDEDLFEDDKKSEISYNWYLSNSEVCRKHGKQINLDILERYRNASNSSYWSRNISINASDEDNDFDKLSVIDTESVVCGRTGNAQQQNLKADISKFLKDDRDCCQESCGHCPFSFHGENSSTLFVYRARQSPKSKNQPENDEHEHGKKKKIMKYSADENKEGIDGLKINSFVDKKSDMTGKVQPWDMKQINEDKKCFNYKKDLNISETGFESDGNDKQMEEVGF